MVNTVYFSTWPNILFGAGEVLGGKLSQQVDLSDSLPNLPIRRNGLGEQAVSIHSPHITLARLYKEKSKVRLLG